MNVWLPTADMDRTLDLMTGAGFGWARQWISWESVEPTQGSYSWDVLDKVVATAERKNTKLMLILLRAPAWAAPNGGIPRDKQLYARFVSTVATRYKGRVGAYEVWNEANLAGETGGTVNVGEYAELLKAGVPGDQGGGPERSRHLWRADPDRREQSRPGDRRRDLPQAELRL
jgi:beta-glucosidase/6-phospho-beta-glucosidase/beta-galactosidase